MARKNKKEELAAEEPKSPKKLDPQTSPWKDLVASLETPGVKIVNFEPGGKAERQLRFVAAEPKVPFFFPVKDKEVPGQANDWCIMNGLRFLVSKGVYVSLPKSVAEHLMECQNQTALAPSGVMVASEGGSKPARLDLRSEKDQEALN